MSWGSTWTSPPLPRATRRAASPQYNQYNAGPDVAGRCSPTNTSASATHPPSPVRQGDSRPPSSRHILRPASSRSIGELNSLSATQYSSFTPNEVFPVAIAVRNPMLSQRSPMSRGVESRVRRTIRSRDQDAKRIEHEQCSQELDGLRGLSIMQLRTPCMSTPTPGDGQPESVILREHIGMDRRPASAARSGTTSAGAGGAPSEVSVADASSHLGPVHDAPILRIETPLPNHPLARFHAGSVAGGSRATSAAATRNRTYSTGITPRQQQQQQSQPATTGSGGSQLPLAENSGGAGFGPYAAVVANGSIASTLTTPRGPSGGTPRPTSTLVNAALINSSSMNVLAARTEQPIINAPPTKLGTRKSMQWTVKRPTSAAQRREAETLQLLYQATDAATPLDSRPCTPNPWSKPPVGANNSTSSGSSHAGPKAIDFNRMLRVNFARPASAPATGPFLTSNGKGGLGDDDHVRPLRSFVG